MNVSAILFDNAAADPSAAALVAGGRVLSHAALRERTGRVACALRALGVANGDRVAVLLPNVPEFVELYLAITAIGAVVMPVNTRLNPREHVTLLQDCEPVVLVASADGRETVELASRAVAGLRHVVVVGDRWQGASSYEALIADADRAPAPVDVDADDPAVILYTSGTTSGPKGAILTHGNLLSNMRQYQAFVGIPRGGVNLQLSPLYHAASIFCFVHLLAGGTTVFVDKTTPREILAAIETHRVTFMFTVPTVLYGILDAPEIATHDISSLRTLQYGGAAITGARLEAALATFGDCLLHSYGMTETTSHASILGKTEHRLAVGSVGRPLPGVKMKIVDDRGVDRPAGEVGEIVVRGANVTKGYWRKPAETAEALAGGWLHTGDLGRVNDDGYFYIVGRKKDLIISGGVNIYPTDIEDVIARHEAVAEVAVFGVPDAVWGEAVAAAVVLRPGRAVDPDALKAFVRESLGGFKVPKAIYYLGTLPKNATGKILKRDLRATVQAGGFMGASPSA